MSHVRKPRELLENKTRRAFLLLFALFCIAGITATLTFHHPAHSHRVVMIAAPRELRGPDPTTTTTTAPPPTTLVLPTWPKAPKRASRSAAPRGDVLGRIRACESGGNYNTNTGNGFYGAYQFDRQTAASVGMNWGNATPAEQDAAAARLYAQRGSAPWPVCGRR